MRKRDDATAMAATYQPSSPPTEPPTFDTSPESTAAWRTSWTGAWNTHAPDPAGCLDLVVYLDRYLEHTCPRPGWLPTHQWATNGDATVPPPLAACAPAHRALGGRA